MESSVRLSGWRPKKGLTTGHSTPEFAPGQMTKPILSHGARLRIGNTAVKRLGGFLAGLGEILGLAPAINDQVHEGQMGMPVGHVWPGVTHHHTDTFAHVGPVAMHFAVDARGLEFLEWAFLQATQGVVEQLLAVCTQIAFGAVFAMAIDVDHRLDRACFAL